MAVSSILDLSTAKATQDSFLGETHALTVSPMFGLTEKRTATFITPAETEDAWNRRTFKIRPMESNTNITAALLLKPIVLTVTSSRGKTLT